jgi:hypothetical protein
MRLNDGCGMVFTARHATGEVYDPLLKEKRDAEEKTDMVIALENGLVGMDDKPETLLCPMQSVCPEHPENRLHLSEQTRIIPFKHRRSCCAVVNGERCGKRIGMMFACCCKVEEAEKKKEKKKKSQKGKKEKGDDERREPHGEVDDAKRRTRRTVRRRKFPAMKEKPRRS